MKFSLRKYAVTTAAAIITLLSGMSSAHAYDWYNKHYQSFIFGLASAAHWANDFPISSESMMARAVMQAWKDTPLSGTIWYRQILNSKCYFPDSPAAEISLTRRIYPDAYFPDNSNAFFGRAALLKITLSSDNLKYQTLCRWIDNYSNPPTLEDQLKMIRNPLTTNADTLERYRTNKLMEYIQLSISGSGSTSNYLEFEKAYNAHNLAYLNFQFQRESLKKAWDLKQSNEARYGAAYLKTLDDTRNYFRAAGAELKKGANILVPGYLP